MPQWTCLALNWVGWGFEAAAVYFEKIRVFKAGFIAVNILAWNNEIRLWLCFVGFNGQSND